MYLIVRWFQPWIFFKPFVHNYRNVTCNVPRKPHQDELWIVRKWLKTSNSIDSKFVSNDNRCVYYRRAAFPIVPCTNLWWLSCSPRWLAQMIALPAYSSSVICPYNTYTHSHTHNSLSSAPLSSEKKAAFHVEMSAFTLHFFSAVWK